MQVYNCHYFNLLLGCSYPDATIIFFDSFNADTQGAFIENVIHLPPLNGLGYNWEVLPGDKTNKVDLPWLRY